MLNRLGFRHFAYDWRDSDIPKFDEEIAALKRNGIDLLAWWFPLGADDPRARTTLETFKRNAVHPQLWVMLPPASFPQTPEEWTRLLPVGMAMPRSQEELEKLSETDKAEHLKALHATIAQLNRESLTKTPQEQEQRVRQEADRIHELVKLAAPYGSKVALYNHNGWFGMMDNQVAIIERLAALGVTGVGIVYNFSHARDELHDDTVNFPAIWKKIKPYVVAVNVTGTHWEGSLVYPSQGDRELELLRTIEESGWRGPIGLIAEKGGDAELTLRDYLIGFDWLMAELRQPGSGGPRPFPPAR
jgi:sugar phosphate isomerase/epimerase